MLLHLITPSFPACTSQCEVHTSQNAKGYHGATLPIILQFIITFNIGCEHADMNMHSNCPTCMKGVGLWIMGCLIHKFIKSACLYTGNDKCFTRYSVFSIKHYAHQIEATLVTNSLYGVFIITLLHSLHSLSVYNTASLLLLLNDWFSIEWQCTNSGGRIIHRAICGGNTWGNGHG